MSLCNTISIGHKMMMKVCSEQQKKKIVLQKFAKKCFFLGSEHIVGDKKYAGELHLVHKGVKNPGKLAVLAVFLEIDEHANMRHNAKRYGNDGMAKHVFDVVEMNALKKVAKKKQKQKNYIKKKQFVAFLKVDGIWCGSADQSCARAELKIAGQLLSSTWPRGGDQRHRPFLVEICSLRRLVDHTAVHRECGVDSVHGPVVDQPRTSK